MSASPLTGLSDRLRTVAFRHESRVCLGIDPRPEAHPSTHPSALDFDGARIAKAVTTYFRDVMDACHDIVACVKIQSAFFERLGVPGWIGMAQLLADARSLDLPVILDAKRGDIGSTAQAYADAYLGEGAFVADALTVNPYLGFDTLEPFVSRAAAEGRGVFCLVRTSNPGAGDLQELTTSDGRTVSEHVADALTERAYDLGVDAFGYGPIGAVVGATAASRIAAFRRRLPHSLLLVPGYGAQGATAHDVAGAFDDEGWGAIVNASRSLTYLEGDDPPREARTAALAMRQALAHAIASR